MKRFFAKTLPIGAIAFLFASLLVPEMSFAAEAARSKTLENMAQTISALVHVLTGAAFLLMQFMPPLWGTELITGPQILGALKPSWIFIRNIMNMVFVLLLIITIFVNLITAGGTMGGSKWTIKEKLGKIILGLVAVNFSLLTVKVLADAVYVGTIGLLTIADTAIEAKGTKDVQEMMDLLVDQKKYTVCKKKGGDCKPVRDIVNKTFCKSKDPKKDYCFFKIKDKIDTSSMQDPEKKNILLAFGVHFMRIESLPILAANTKSIWAVLDNALFSIVMAIAYILALAAVFVVLIVRVVMMWVMILLSPILVTGWVLGWSGGAFDQINGRFWKYLVVPLKIAAVFAFTFVLIGTLDAVVPSPQFYTEYLEPGPQLKPFWGDEKFKGWQFVWKIFIVVLFWKAIFLAMDDIEDVKGITSGIQSFGSNMGKMALTYGADQVKLPGVAGGSLAGLGNINNKMSAATRSIANDGVSNSSLPGAFNQGNKNKTKGTKKFNSALSKANKNIRSLSDTLEQEKITREELISSWPDMKKDSRLKGVTSNGTEVNTMNGTEFANALEKANRNVFSRPAPVVAPKKETPQATEQSTLSEQSVGTLSTAITEAIGNSKKVDQSTFRGTTFSSLKKADFQKLSDKTGKSLDEVKKALNINS